MQAHPELLTPLHPYHPDLERSRFDLQRVDAFLTQFSLARRVNKTGQITLGGQHQYYMIHRQYAGQIVQVHFDPSDRCFVAILPDEQGHLKELKRWPARNLAIDDLIGPALPLATPIPCKLPLPFNLVALPSDSKKVNCF